MPSFLGSDYIVRESDPLVLEVWMKATMDSGPPNVYQPFDPRTRLPWESVEVAEEWVRGMLQHQEDSRPPLDDPEGEPDDNGEPIP